jgi:hypothetical protein
MKELGNYVRSLIIQINYDEIAKDKEFYFKHDASDMEFVDLRTVVSTFDNAKSLCNSILKKLL